MTTQEKCVKCDFVAPLRTNVTRSLTQKTIKNFPVRTKPFEPSLFPHCAKAWRNLIKELRDIYSINRFKCSILNFVRPIGNSVFVFHDINGVKLQARLRMVFSHLNEHECQRNFNHIKKPKWLSAISCAATFIQLSTRTPEWFCALSGSLNNFSEENILKILLYGAEDFTSQVTSEILKCMKKFIKKQIAFLLWSSI